MKKSVAALLGAAVVISVQAWNAPAASAHSLPLGDTWRGPQPYSFTYPSNWRCGQTVDVTYLSQQTCIARDGDYAQAVTVVRNRSDKPARLASAMQRLHYADGTRTEHQCTNSEIPGRRVSVCYSRPVYSPKLVWAYATVATSLGGAETRTPWL